MKNPKITPRVATSTATLLVALMAALPCTLNAQTWTGGFNTSWGNAGNWTPGTPAFNTTTDVLFDTNAVTNPDTHLFANRVVRSITFGENVDGPISVTLREFLASGNARTLTLQADSGNASININSGSTGDVTIGVASGSLVLGSALDIVHNGTGTLLINRPITGGFDITKSGSGILQLGALNSATGALNISGGTVIASAQSLVGADINAFSSLNLQGGTLTVRTQFANKAIDSAALVVSAASTLDIQGAPSGSFNYGVTFSGTADFALNADLTYTNTSAITSFVNALNINRNITGTGNLIIETYNDIASSAANYGLGRLLLAGDNTGWEGDIIISRGTVSLGGTSLNGVSAGTGQIVLGTTADGFGAGLTFFSTATNASTITYGNNITVRSGGFRSIKGGNTDHGYAFTGNVALEGDLNIDHTMSSIRTINFSGEISGIGGISVTRAAGSAATSAVLSGANTYTGATSVATGASLLLSGSLTSSVVVDLDARFGGNGSTTGDVTFNDGARLIFNPLATLTVDGSVSLANSFGITSLVNADGSAIDWASVGTGTFTLIANNSNFSNISNFGIGNAADLGNGLSAYFQNGSLQLTIIPEPSSYALFGGLAVIGLATLRRRRTA